MHYEKHLLNSITHTDTQPIGNTVGIMNMLVNPNKLNDIRRSNIPNSNQGFPHFPYILNQKFFMPYMGYPMMPFNQMNNNQIQNNTENK